MIVVLLSIIQLINSSLCWKFSVGGLCFQLHTLVPAYLSFTEDCDQCISLLSLNLFFIKPHSGICEFMINELTEILIVLFHLARILRGLRISARLGLSFSKDIEIAICKLVPSVSNLAKVLFWNFS